MDYPWAVPGAKVVCVKRDKWNGVNGETMPFFGQRLTIRDAFMHESGNLVLRFHEISNAPRNYGRGVVECSFKATRFRPLITQSDDIAKFTHLLNTTDLVVDA